MELLLAPELNKAGRVSPHTLGCCMATCNIITTKGPGSLWKGDWSAGFFQQQRDLKAAHISLGLVDRDLQQVRTREILQAASCDHSGGEKQKIFAYCFRCLKYPPRRDHHNSKTTTKNKPKQTPSIASVLMCRSAGRTARKNKGTGNQVQLTCTWQGEREWAKQLETKPLLSSGKTYRKLSKLEKKKVRKQ